MHPKERRKIMKGFVLYECYLKKLKGQLNFKRISQNKAIIYTMNTAAFDRMRSDQAQAERVMRENMTIVTEAMLLDFRASIQKVNEDPARNKNTAELLVMFQICISYVMHIHL